MPEARPRVVSLVPSSTETLLALGADVVACTRFCEQPGMLTVGGTKNPAIEAIAALAPDLVVLDVEENRREDAEALRSLGLQLVITAVTSLATARNAVDALAEATGAPPPAPVAVQARSESSITATAFVPIWRRPWMSINAQTYGADVLDALGVTLITAEHDDTYPVVELDVMAAASPDLVLVPSEPYEFTDEHLDAMRAVFVGSEVLRIDGRDLFWWGSRTPGALERLGRALNAIRRRRRQ